MYSDYISCFERSTHEGDDYTYQWQSIINSESPASSTSAMGNKDSCMALTAWPLSGYSGANLSLSEER